MQLDPEGSLGFLVSDIARLLRAQFNDTAQSLGLTLAQARALLQLSRNQGISQVALAELLEIQPITLLRQLDRLAEAGLVERRANPRDRRAQQLYLTHAADSLLDRISSLGTALTETAMTGIGQRERERLIRHLQRIKRNLSATPANAASAIPAPRGMP